MKKISIITAVLMMCCAAAKSADIVPKPVSMEKGSGVFILTPDTWINYTSQDITPLADYLAGYITGCRKTQSIQAYNSFSRKNDQIYLEIDGAMNVPDEGYRLSVTANRVRICGKDYGGLFNGIQTFLQLLPPEVYAKNCRNFYWQVDGIIIEDYPRFGYRGVMLDVARTFVPKEELLRFIDNISFHKINKLHLHLTDDEGWRIEIKSYPQLTETGAFRGGDSPVRPIYGAWDRRYGGYYTQFDIMEIVAYAAARNVEIIPEIELPGHSRAAAIACPEILCGYTPDLKNTAGYDRRNVWCAAKEKNYEMLDRIIGEMARMFPSEYIHLGGDEVEPAQWNLCPACKALMAANGIKDAVGLEGIFMEKAAEIAARHGKKAGVWNEAASDGKLGKSALVYGWENVKECRKAAAAGYPTVVVPGKYFYFDMRQSQTETGHIWAGIVSPETVYSFDFDKEGFTPAEMENVRGVEATFFSELLLSQGMDFLDYQLYPRVCALAELNWTPQEDRSWDDFRQRMDASHYDRMGAAGIKYRTPPTVNPEPEPRRKTPAVAFTSSLAEASRFPFGNLASYKNTARTTSTCRSGDWFLFSFAQPASCNTIRIATGYEHLQRAGIPEGRVEVSYDGKNYQEIGRLHDLGAVIKPEKPVYAIRIVAETDGNGEPFVIIQPLDIR